jgi:hypothetical protein
MADDVKDFQCSNVFGDVVNTKGAGGKRGDPGKFLGLRYGAAPGRVDSGADIDDFTAVHRQLLRVRKRRLDGRESPESGVALSAHDDRPGADLVEKSVTSGALIRPHRPSL